MADSRSWRDRDPSATSSSSSSSRRSTSQQHSHHHGHGHGSNRGGKQQRGGGGRGQHISVSQQQQQQQSSMPIPSGAAGTAVTATGGARRSLHHAVGATISNQPSSTSTSSSRVIGRPRSGSGGSPQSISSSYDNLDELAFASGLISSSTLMSSSSSSLLSRTSGGGGNDGNNSMVAWLNEPSIGAYRPPSARFRSLPSALPSTLIAANANQSTMAGGSSTGVLSGGGNILINDYGNEHGHSHYSGGSVSLPPSPTSSSHSLLSGSPLSSSSLLLQNSTPLTSQSSLPTGGGGGGQGGRRTPDGERNRSGSGSRSTGTSPSRRAANEAAARFNELYHALHALRHEMASSTQTPIIAGTSISSTGTGASLSSSIPESGWSISREWSTCYRDAQHCEATLTRLNACVESLSGQQWPISGITSSATADVMLIICQLLCAALSFTSSNASVSVVPLNITKRRDDPNYDNNDDDDENDDGDNDDDIENDDGDDKKSGRRNVAASHIAELQRQTAGVATTFFALVSLVVLRKQMIVAELSDPQLSLLVEGHLALLHGTIIGSSNNSGSAASSSLRSYHGEWVRVDGLRSLGHIVYQNGVRLVQHHNAILSLLLPLVDSLTHDHKDSNANSSNNSGGSGMSGLTGGIGGGGSLIYDPSRMAQLRLGRMAINCLGNLCVKSGNTLSNHYASISTTILNAFRVFSVRARDDFRLTTMLSASLRALHNLLPAPADRPIDSRHNNNNATATSSSATPTTPSSSSLPPLPSDQILIGLLSALHKVMAWGTPLILTANQHNMGGVLDFGVSLTHSSTLTPLLGSGGSPEKKKLSSGSQHALQSATSATTPSTTLSSGGTFHPLSSPSLFTMSSSPVPLVLPRHSGGVVRDERWADLRRRFNSNNNSFNGGDPDDESSGGGTAGGSASSDGEGQREGYSLSSAKVRSYALSCLQSIARHAPRLFYQHWTPFMPSDATSALSARPFSGASLITVLLHDPAPKVRTLAATTLAAMLDGSPLAKWVGPLDATLSKRSRNLRNTPGNSKTSGDTSPSRSTSTSIVSPKKGQKGVASNKAAAKRSSTSANDGGIVSTKSSSNTSTNSTFTSLSARYAEMVRGLHAGLLEAMSREHNGATLSQILKCIGVLVANTPYQHMAPRAPGLLIPIVTHLVTHLLREPTAVASDVVSALPSSSSSGSGGSSGIANTIDGVATPADIRHAVFTCLAAIFEAPTAICRLSKFLRGDGTTPFHSLILRMCVTYDRLKS
jgi:hypothetical protein